MRSPGICRAWITSSATTLVGTIKRTARCSRQIPHPHAQALPQELARLLQHAIRSWTVRPSAPASAATPSRARASGKSTDTFERGVCVSITPRGGCPRAQRAGNGNTPPTPWRPSFTGPAVEGDVHGLARVTVYPGRILRASALRSRTMRIRHRRVAFMAAVLTVVLAALAPAGASAFMKSVWGPLTYDGDQPIPSCTAHSARGSTRSSSIGTRSSA